MISKKAQFNYLLSFMLGVLCFFLGLALASPMTDVVQEATNSTELNCTGTLTTMQEAVCTQLDIFPMILVGLLFGLGGATVGGFL